MIANGSVMTAPRHALARPHAAQRRVAAVVFGVIGLVTAIVTYFGLAFGYWPGWLVFAVAAAVLPAAAALAAVRRAPTPSTERALGAGVAFAVAPAALLVILLVRVLTVR